MLKRGIVRISVSRSNIVLSLLKLIVTHLLPAKPVAGGKDGARQKRFLTTETSTIPV
jgi:hypothetical protein